MRAEAIAVVVVGWAAWFAVSLLLGWGVPPWPVLVIVAVIEVTFIRRRVRTVKKGRSR